MEDSRFILALLLVFFVSNAFGHSYVTSPTSRSNQKATNSGCRGPNCLGPCDISLSKATRAPISIARGDTINVQWPRNNHAGGFIRIAWAQTSGSDSHANFDNGVQQISCHENGGCFPNSKTDPNGGDSGPADGSSRACSTAITVPSYLSDGLWTMQWAWFGGAFALGDYYSCVDYKVSGGPTGSKMAAVFIGGDYTYPGQNKCKFFNTDRLHQCVNEPCNNPVYPGGERSGPAFMADQPSSTTTTTTTTSTTGTPTPSRLTTQRVNTPSLTTSKVGSGTTTTSSSGGSTTTTGNPSVVNCAQATQVISSTAFTVTAVELQGDSFRMQVRMDVTQTVANWMVQVIWPSDATSTSITTIYSLGVLRCSANYPVRHSMISPASYMPTLIGNNQYFLEFVATNTNMNADFLRLNTMFVMFQQ